jgi:hypothetical protein
VLVAGVCAGVAYAKASVGRQNPQLRVRVSIIPDHPVPGDTVIERVRIVNTTNRTLRGEWRYTLETPSNGIGAAIGGARLRPGVLVVDVLRSKVTASSPSGSYTVAAEASDGRGSSHARVRVTIP